MKEDNDALTRSFLQAVDEGDNKKMKILIKNGANINIKDKMGYPPTHAAIILRYKKIVKTLVENKANINAKDGGNNTILHYASDAGHHDIVQLAIEKGANVNAQNHWHNTPLYEAVSGGREEIVKTLIKNKADIQIKNGKGYTALHKAAQRDYKKIVRMLLENKADINAKNGKGSTPLHEAARKGCKEVVKMLIRKGADMKAMDENGNTPMHSAALNGHEEIVRILLQKEGGIDIENQNGVTPLQILFDKKTPKWQTWTNLLEAIPRTNVPKKVVSQLMYKAIDGFADGSVANKTKAKIMIFLTILDKKIPQGKKSVLEALLKKDDSKKLLKEALKLGWNPNKPNKDNHSAVDIAAQERDMETLKILEKFGGRATEKTITFAIKKKYDTQGHDVSILDSKLFLKLVEMGANPFSRKLSCKHVEELVKNGKSLDSQLKESLRDPYRKRIDSKQKSNHTFTDEKIRMAYEKGRVLDKTNNSLHQVNKSMFSPKAYFRDGENSARHKMIAEILQFPNAASTVLSSRSDRGIAGGWNGKKAHDCKKSFFDPSSLPFEIKEYIVSFLIRGNRSINSRIFNYRVKAVTKTLIDYYNEREKHDQHSNWRAREQEQRKKSEGKNISMA